MVRHADALEVVGHLLQGGCTLFGRRIEITFPDGDAPPAELLAEAGRHWAPHHDGMAVMAAEDQICKVPVPCGRVKQGWRCTTHG